MEFLNRMLQKVRSFFSFECDACGKRLGSNYKTCPTCDEYAESWQSFRS